MKKYQIKCLDRDGHISCTIVVRCKDMMEAQRLAPTSPNEAVVIRPLATGLSGAPRGAAPIKSDARDESAATSRHGG
jgi:hypothetical protein